MIFFAYSLPAMLYLVLAVLRIRQDLIRPPAIAFGCIIPKVCVVNAEEIKGYCLETLERAANHLGRERRLRQFRILWGFLREMSANTRLFQGASRFEQIKIDPCKSALDFEQRETLIFELMPETAEMRMKLYKAQVNLLTRTVLGLKVDRNVLLSILGDYKRLESDIIALAGMSKDTCYRDMLIEALGLGRWRIFEGGSEPESA